MASESSSAMLDLNDADSEDIEAPSVIDDAREGAPLMMEPGYDIAVKVDAPMKQLSTLETFVTYRVRCVCARWPTPPAVRRRYNHFKLLHKRLSGSQPWLAPPALPPLHTARQQLDRYSASFVAIRTMALHSFLDRIAKHPIFTHSEDFRLFITTPDEELDKVFKNENSALNLWGLSSALYGGQDNKPTNGARVKDPEWAAHVEYLTSLQQKLTTLCTLSTRLHRGTTALHAESINMKRTCDVWSSQARGATGRACAALAASLPHPLPSTHPLPLPLPPPRAAARLCAVLPLLAGYTQAQVEKIKQRDALHAAYVAGASTTGEMHNKLQQASEALRAELSDWLPKTRAEVKSLLLELAQEQVCRLTQSHAAWEHALGLTNDANVADLFKTVSKTAVQNLSPSKCRSEMTPTETERDLDELEICSEDSEGVDQSKNSTENWVEVNHEHGVESLSVHGVDPLSIQKIDPLRKHKVDPLSFHQVDLEPLSIQKLDLDPVSTEKVDPLSLNQVDLGPLSIQKVDPFSINQVDLDPLSIKKVEPLSIHQVDLDPFSIEKVDPLSINQVDLGPLSIEKVDPPSLHRVELPSKEEIDPLSIQGVVQEKEDFLSVILDDSGQAKSDSASLEQSLKSDVSDPLREFSEIDLSGDRQNEELSL